jgi:hypothetical protein
VDIASGDRRVSRPRSRLPGSSKRDGSRAASTFRSSARGNCLS